MLVLGLLVLLAACSEAPTGEVTVPQSTACGDTVSTPTADTMIAAEVDGRPFLVAAGAPGAAIRLARTGQRLTLLGQDSRGSEMRGLRVWFTGFHGVGGYSLASSSGAGAFYQCGGSTHWTGVGGADSAWISAFDSTTGHLEGTFAFASPNGEGSPVQVTGGRFRGEISIDSLPPTCTNAVDAPTADTLVGARVEGRMVLARKGSPHSLVDFDGYGVTTLTIFGWSITDSVAQILDLRIYGLHGVGSYPIADGYDSGTAFAAFGCRYVRDDFTTVREVISYFPFVTNVPGDSVHVTAWDSVSGHLRGTYQFHSMNFVGDTVAITGGTFDVMVPR